MRTDILDFHEFYRSRLGTLSAQFIGARLVEAWGDGSAQRVAGFGFAPPYLDLFSKAERRIAMAPGAQGVTQWPCDNASNSATLVGETCWPLPDASIDRLLIIHGLEESSDPRRLMREAWRVLTPDGRLIIVCAHRRGAWSLFETTPFAAGRPYLKGQLTRLLEEAMFGGPLQWNAALYFPPVQSRFVLSSANAWERAGNRVWPGLAGVLMVEATKDMLAPAGFVRTAKERALRPALGTARPAGAGRNSLRDKAQ